jgi:hypothetical protein
MSNRTHRSSITFNRPFVLKGWKEPHPAGTYALETEEELVEGLSFPAWRRVSTTITHQTANARATTQMLPVEPADLARAQAADLL